jgi:hypothetical protein
MSLILLGFALALATFVHRPLLGRLGAGTLQHLVRLPGNLLHELAHAVAMLLTGYTVAGFSVSITDPAGRGGVRPGPAWLPIARPWITNLISPVAPVGFGVVALSLLARWSGAPGLVLDPRGAWVALSGAPYQTWQLWVGLALGFSVTAELAPSSIDLAAWWRPAAVVGVLLGAVAYGLEQYAPGSVTSVLPTLDTLVRPWAGRALAMAVWSALAFAPVAWAVGKVRGG